MPYTDKVAGLESHQFVRDQHRFNTTGIKCDPATLPRQPRIGNNSRNTSSTVFQFGGSLDVRQRN